VSELGYLFLTMSSLHIIAQDLDVRDQSCWMMIKLELCQIPEHNKGFVTLHILLTTVKCAVLNKPYIHY
jgi:hypothetical protein